MQVTDRSNPLLALLGIVVLCALGWLAWRLSFADEPASPLLAPATSALPATKNPAREALEPIRDSQASPSRSLPLTEVGPAKSQPEEIASAPPDGNPAILLISDFIAPDGKPLVLQSALARLHGLDGAQRSVQTQRSGTIRIEGLARQLYTLDVEAEDFVHRQQTIDLSTGGGLRPNALGELVCTEQTILWPAGWVAIVVETSDAQPLRRLAEQAQVPPGKLFVGAFQVLTSRRAPDGFQTNEDSSESLARFVPPRGYQSWQLPGNCIGSLERFDPALFWVELRLYGTSIGSQAFAPGQTELVFRIDRAHMEERMASLRLRVLELDGQSPVQGALVTLNASISALRRDDQKDSPSASGGCVDFNWIVPGRYELSVIRGESLHQTMLDMKPGEQRDLGDILLGESAGLPVLVVDSRGEPVRAYVEIAPYTRGARSSELYPPMLRHQSGRDGLVVLPMPSGISIVRASTSMGRNHSDTAAQELRGPHSANVLIDPSQPTPQQLLLTLHSPVAVQVKIARPEGTRLELLDELDLVVARTPQADALALNIELIPGRYRARARYADDSLSPEIPFEVEEKPLQLKVD